jgi:hypothetical protein
MTEASNDVNISHHAELLAKDSDFNYSEVEGTGRAGMITKADIELAIAQAPTAPEPEPQVPTYKAVAADEPEIDPELAKLLPESVAFEPEQAEGFTNIMEAQVAAREAAQGGPDAPSDESVIQTATNEDLISLIMEMRGEISQLKEQTAGLVNRDTYTRDLTDDMFFIAKPGGQKWEERRVRDKRTILVEFVGTAFFGPFKDKEIIETYLKEKSRKREDSYLEWEGISVLTGKDARLLDRQETADREAEFTSDVSTNVLDKRIWDQNSQRDPDAGIAEVIGPAA